MPVSCTSQVFVKFLFGVYQREECGDAAILIPIAIFLQITEEGLTALAAHLGGQHSRVWRERMVLLDLNGKVALMKDGQLVATWSFSPSGEKLAASKPGSALGNPPGVAGGAAPPKVTSASPTAVFLGRRGRTTVRLVGRGITCGDCKVVCRAGGAYRQVACQPFGPCCAAGEGHSDDAVS